MLRGAERLRKARASNLLCRLFGAGMRTSHGLHSVRPRRRSGRITVVGASSHSIIVGTTFGRLTLFHAS